MGQVAMRGVRSELGGQREQDGLRGRKHPGAGRPRDSRVPGTRFVQFEQVMRHSDQRPLASRFVQAAQIHTPQAAVFSCPKTGSTIALRRRYSVSPGGRYASRLYTGLSSPESGRPQAPFPPCGVRAGVT